MTKLLECDVAVMGSGVAGMGAAYKLANAGDLKIAQGMCADFFRGRASAASDAAVSG